MNSMRIVLLFFALAIVMCFASDESENFLTAWLKPSPMLRSSTRARFTGRLLPRRMYRSAPSTWNDLPAVDLE